MARQSNRDGNVSRARQGNEAVAELARNALKAFKADAKEAYGQLTKAYEGASAVVGIFGMGAVTVSVANGQVDINPETKDRAKVLGRGAIYPETLVAISKGEITPIEAFHKGDLLARAESSELHKAYGFLLKFSGAAMQSPKLQEVLTKFQKQANL